jgi:hypothetical protein
MGNIGVTDWAQVAGLNKALEEVGAGREPDVEQLGGFSQGHSRDEVARRLKGLSAWLIAVNAYNHDGVTITPGIAGFLSQEREIDALLGELDQLREQTRNGRFSLDNELQRDLEFRRFSSEYDRFLGRGKPPEELYSLFTALDELPPLERGRVVLSDQRLIDARRAAYESALFLEWLREFRSHTSRPIVVIANDKAQMGGGGYGRQWVVEPIEDYLRDDFAVRYDRVTSHAKMRLSVPAAFPKSFVRELCDQMPNIVIADGGRVVGEHEPRAKMDGHMVRFSRTEHGYANWFLVFNYLRARGDLSRYQSDTLFPASELDELRKWHEFVIVREQIEEWVTPGPTYKMALWGPEPTEHGLMGETKVVWPEVAFEGDTPLVVFANPIVYQSKASVPGIKVGATDDRLAGVLRDSEPFALNELDIEVEQRDIESAGTALIHWGAVMENLATTVFGFGAHGFEMQTAGPSVEMYVAAIQRHIRAEVDRLQQGA